MNTDEIVDSLVELQKRRQFFIKRQIMVDNSSRALVRRVLGWQSNMSEKDREQINKQAARIVNTIRKDKEPKPEDVEHIEQVKYDVVYINKMMEPLTNGRKGIEDEMVRLVKQLNVYEWAKNVHGFGSKGLAVLIGTTGNPNNFPNPAKMKKYLGLAPYQGYAPSTYNLSKAKRPRTLSSEEWKDVRYDPKKFGELYGVIMEPLVKNGGYYKRVYDMEKERFKPKAQNDGHTHKHAMRVMMTELMINYWRVWHGYEPRMSKFDEYLAEAA